MADRDREAYEYYLDPEHRELTGTPVKRNASRLTTMSSIRFAPEVIEAVKGRASEEGVTVGSWIRRLVQREIAEPEMGEIATPDGPVRVPSASMRDLVAALTPYLFRHGSADLRIGPLQAWQSGAVMTTAAAVAVQRPSGLIEGSARKGEPKELASSPRLRPRTFSCPHMSAGNVISVSCETCGPLQAAA